MMELWFLRLTSISHLAQKLWVLSILFAQIGEILFFLSVGWDKDTLGERFASCPKLGIAAEHGYFLRYVLFHFSQLILVCEVLEAGYYTFSINGKSIAAVWRGVSALLFSKRFCLSFAVCDFDGILFPWALVKVLVVHEKYSASTPLGAWKLPTGFIHVLRSQTIRRVHGMIWALIAMSVIEERLVALWQSEDIFTGAVKEVKEETGVRNGLSC